MARQRDRSSFVQMREVMAGLGIRKEQVEPDQEEGSTSKWERDDSMEDSVGRLARRTQELQLKEGSGVGGQDKRPRLS